ncbi:MAG TPA: recombination protein RecR [Candidatus Magasanikbacteria bacterium]|nr:recombination protein RecR [Candidatus Magasanikbacteria bacterium]
MLPTSIHNLVQLFTRLPGIGPKVAERFVYHFLMNGKGEVKRFIDGFEELAKTIQSCESCFTFAESSPCSLCGNAMRDKTMVCVVAMPSQIPAIEKTGYHGVYHVLRGVINPSEDKGPEHLKIIELKKRTGIKELILALNPDLDGEATMLYLQQEFKNTGVTITRLARGLPMGSDIEYADEITLGDAFKNRKTL